MSDRSYIYGQDNGSSYDTSRSVKPVSERKTHWDPRIQVQSIAGTVQVGVVPPSETGSTPDSGVWDPDDGQFMSLSRDGLNRLIEALQEAGAATYGRDRW